MASLKNWILIRDDISKLQSDINVILTLLHITLWLSFVKVSQLVEYNFENDLIFSVCETARASPEYLYNCLCSQAHMCSSEIFHISLHTIRFFGPGYFSSNPASYSAETLNEDKEASGLFHLDNEKTVTSIDGMEHTTSKRLVHDLGDIRLQWNPKVNLTLEPCCILVQWLIFHSFESHWDPCLVKFVQNALGHCLGFANCKCLLKWPLADECIEQNMSHTEFLHLVNTLVLNTRFCSFVRLEFLRASLLLLLRYLFQCMATAITSLSREVLPSLNDVNLLTKTLIEIPELAENRSMLASVSLVKGLYCLLALQASDEYDAQIAACFSHTLSYFSGASPDSSILPKENFISLLYPCWVLAHYFRSQNHEYKAHYYETLFRYLRYHVANCPLPYCFPFRDEKVTSASNENVLWNQHCKFLHQYSVLWLSASHILNFTSCHQVLPSCDIEFVVDTGNLFSFGSNALGCLGLGYPTTESRFDQLQKNIFFYNGDVWWTPEPTRVLISQHHCITDIRCGANHCLALSNDGVVFSWGCNENGQLGRPNDNTTPEISTQLHKINWLSDAATYARTNNSFTRDQIRGSRSQFSCNEEMTKMQSYGSGMKAEKKQISNSQEILCPKPTPVVAFLTAVTFINCGLNFSAAITQDGKLFMWGANEMGQLGLGDCLSRFSPTEIQTIANPVTVVSCGHQHTAAITSQSSLWLWGSNSHGQLGFPLPHSTQSTADQEILTFVTTPQQIFVYECGFLNESLDTSFNESQLSKIYGTPENPKLLWRRDLESETYYAAFNAHCDNLDEAFVQDTVLFLGVSCGYSHTLAFDITNSVWAWGSGSHGELGLGFSFSDSSNTDCTLSLLFESNINLEESNRKIRTSPCRLYKHLFSHHRILHVFAGKYISSAIDDEYHAWFWGSNRYHGLTFPRHVHSFCEKPICSITLKDDEIQSIHYGWDGTHQAVVTENGRFALWGKEDLVLSCRTFQSDLSWRSPYSETEGVVLDTTAVPFTNGGGNENEPIERKISCEIPSISLPNFNCEITITQLALGSNHCLLLVKQ